MEGKKDKPFEGTSTVGVESGIYDDVEDDDYEDPIDPYAIDSSSRGRLGYQDPGVHVNQGQGHFGAPVLPPSVDDGYIGRLS